jgi:hypothetical protein
MVTASSTECLKYRGDFKVGTSVQADARFLRRIMLTMIVVTVAAGAMAGLATVNAKAEQGVSFCQSTGFLCGN